MKIDELFDRSTFQIIHKRLYLIPKTLERLQSKEIIKKAVNSRSDKESAEKIATLPASEDVKNHRLLIFNYKNKKEK